MSLSKPWLPSMLLIALAGWSGARAQDQSTRDQPTPDQPPAPTIAQQPRPHHVYLAGQLRIMQPWIDSGTDTKDHADGFIIIENRGSAPDRLVGARVGIASHVSISPSASETETTTDLTIPPNGLLALKQGDAHLVLHDLQHDIKTGDRIAGTVIFERAGPVEVEFSTNRTDAINDDQTDTSSATGEQLVK